MHARVASGATATVLALYASVRLFHMLPAQGSFKVLGMVVRHSALWAGIAFVVLSGLIVLLISGAQTGIKKLDATSHGLIDLLIDTETELGKVSWPTRDELKRATVAVLVSIIVLAAFLLCTDIAVGFFMRQVGVLPR